MAAVALSELTAAEIDIVRDIVLFARFHHRAPLKTSGNPNSLLFWQPTEHS
jgi:hypothetical protein